METTVQCEILIVGGGHAGCEAAMAAARLGKDVVLVTGAIERIAAMSCNPAIGGVGKGHLVKELDALGGEMGKVADATGIHFRTLNESRGPAVRATRCQSDMVRYQVAMSRVVATTPGLRVHQADVVALDVQDGRPVGVRTGLGEHISARAVIITTGTFLGGKLHLGTNTTPGGRAGEAPGRGLSASLAQAGLQLGRLKTGTCPRLDARTIDMDQLEQQLPEDPAPRFSLESGPPPLPQVSCRLTRTNRETNAIIAAATERGEAPLFNGQIGGAGPRYCPSIEDKVVRFAHKSEHLIFLEPHGLDTFEIYPNGLSTSLPPKTQLAFLRTLPGLRDVHVTRWGYAVEYDFVDPRQLDATLQVRALPGLYCAGQINGTTGYEEAAMQGLIAGVNAACALDGKEGLVLSRTEAYAGVLVDDLISLGTKEPYRMLTSRAEHRLVLREDNAWARLTERAGALGLVDVARQQRVATFEASVTAEQERMATTPVIVTEELRTFMRESGAGRLAGGTTLSQLLKRPEFDVAALGRFDPGAAFVDVSVRFRAATELKYAGYIERARREIERDRALEDAEIPAALLDRLLKNRLPGMSLEVTEKLSALRPQTLGQAARISGVTPAAVGLLAVEIRRHQSA